ncbi:Aste57867_21839 [Aphanomyces stellatus]|uniref:Aste57867_21839 protein n=1 Tax=Aphanomyces stellatus TaxID=120398 RepID=A0A485LIK4_9STRA|nr:hypothetical protein As57867_021770 [Aphanomyces stellatus]VFT98508.1 Aste57867_21839 [Aphanomyces stellatus]
MNHEEHTKQWTSDKFESELLNEKARLENEKARLEMKEEQWSAVGVSHPNKKKHYAVDAQNIDLPNEPSTRHLDFKLEDRTTIDSITPGNMFDVNGLNVAGLNTSDKKILFCRQDTMKLIRSLDKMERGVRIYGPPGVGKSVTTWYWACNQAQKSNKTVLWIHVSSITVPRIIRLTRSDTLALHFRKLSKLSKYVIEAQDDILTQSGYDADLEKKNFSFHHSTSRQAVSIASMFMKRNFEDEEFLRISEFEAAAWSLDEYYTATENEEFAKSVYSFLIDGCSENEKEEEKEEEKVKSNIKHLVDQKYYFTGCSVRWMFQTTVSNVISQIETYFARVPSFVNILKGNIGQQSIDMVNHLACEQDTNKQRFFTSQYTARITLDKDGHEAIRLAYGVADIMGNNSFEGWIVEMDFIQLIKSARGNGLNVTNMENRAIRFEVSGFIRCDVESLSKALIEKAIKKEPTAVNLNNLWFLPSKWNQPGFVLFCFTVCGNRFVLQFIQVTTAKKHALKLQCFRKVALTFAKMDLKIAGIEIFMATPSNLTEFDIPNSMVEGQIWDWFVGNSNEKWRRVKVQNQVKILKFLKTA